MLDGHLPVFVNCELSHPAVTVVTLLVTSYVQRVAVGNCMRTPAGGRNLPRFNSLQKLHAMAN